MTLLMVNISSHALSSFVKPISEDFDLVIQIPDDFETVGQGYLSVSLSKYFSDNEIQKNDILVIDDDQIEKRLKGKQTGFSVVAHDTSKLKKISVGSYSGSWWWQYNASGMLKKALRYKQKEEKNVKILKQSVQKEDKYDTALCLITYINKENNRGMFYGKYFSQKFGGAGVEYEAILSENRSNDEMLEEIEKFIKTSVSFLDRTD